MNMRREFVGRAWPILAAALMALAVPIGAWAQALPEGQDEAAGEIETDPGLAVESDKEAELPPVDITRPTERGIRFTPEFARSIGQVFAKHLRGRYDLDDDQVEPIEKAFERELMTFAHRNEETGQAMIELMMAEMIANEGQFSRDAAMRFGELGSALAPKLKKLMKDLAGAIGHEMTLSQRMKFSADMAAAGAGIGFFEKRMKQWKEGEIPEFVYFRGFEEDSAPEDQVAEDAGETRELREARRSAERTMRWELDIDERWGDYVDRAIAYYKFDDAQANAARAVLKDCQDRVQAYKSEEWQKRVKENRVARQLARRISGDWRRQDPWIFKLESEYERLKRPIEDLDSELKRRIEEIPDSTQRAAAEAKMRERLAEEGLTLTRL